LEIEKETADPQQTRKMESTKVEMDEAIESDNCH
jgi:hypothetical protein